MPYSLCRMVAARNAVAVCPLGHELRVEPSGRISLAVYLMPLTRPAMMAADAADEAQNLGQSLRLSTPAIFNPNVNASGTYCV